MVDMWCLLLYTLKLNDNNTILSHDRIVLHDDVYFFLLECHMNILEILSNSFNKAARTIKQQHHTTKVIVRGNRVHIESPHLLQISESTEHLFKKRHWMMWEGPIAGGVRGVTWDWFLPELLFMLETLVRKKFANPTYATLLLIDELNNKTWVGSAQAKPRIDYKKIKRVLTWTPLPHQQSYLEHYEYSTSKYQLKGGLAAISTGGGKALAHGEPVLTPSGWVPIEDINVGDMVIGSKGREIPVTGVFPQGERPLFNVVFSDGTISKCDGDHLWAVSDTVLSVNQMLDDGLFDSENAPKYRVKIFKGVICSKTVDLAWKPTVLGRLYKNLSNVSTTSIVDEYIRGSETQRHGLFEGLTGHRVGDQPMSFRTASLDLAKSVVDLARGLGIFAVMAKTLTDGTLGYDVREIEGRDSKGIVEIYPVSEGDATCIEVDATDHLFVTRGHTLTHNTYTGIALAEGLSMERIIVLCPKPAIFDPWIVSTQDLYRKTNFEVWASTLKTPPTKTAKYLICNYAYLDKLFEALRYFKKKRTLIIVDESHNLNEMASSQTLSYIKLARTHADEVLHLSGTPLKAATKELIPIMSAIDPRFTDEVAERFVKLMIHSNGGDVLSLIRNRMNRMSFTVEKSAFKLKKPKLVEHIITIPNGDRFTIASVKKDMEIYSNARIKVHMANRPEAIKTYWRLVDKLKHKANVYSQFRRDVNTIIHETNYRMVRAEMKNVSEYEKTYIMPNLNNEDRKIFRKTRGRAKYPKLVVLGEALGNVLGKARIDCNVAIASALKYKQLYGKAKGKCLFFSNHVAAVNAMAITCKKQGYEPLVMYGEHVDNLKEVVKTYRETDANPLGATYASLATAVPLTMVTDVFVLDSPFRDYVLNQAIARAYRLGNDKQVYVHYIMLKTDGENINERSLQLAAWSGAVVAEVLNIEPGVEYPESVYDEIL